MTTHILRSPDRSWVMRVEECVCPQDPHHHVEYEMNWDVPGPTPQGIPSYRANLSCNVYEDGEVFSHFTINGQSNRDFMEPEHAFELFTGQTPKTIERMFKNRCLRRIYA